MRGRSQSVGASRCDSASFFVLERERHSVQVGLLEVVPDDLLELAEPVLHPRLEPVREAKVHVCPGSLE